MIYSFGLSKAGTHLVMATLKEAGYEIFDGVVARNGEVHDTAGQEKTDDGFITKVLSGDVIDWPDPKPMLVLYGHPDYTDANVALIEGPHKVIFSKRDLRTRLISHFRYDQIRLAEKYVAVENGLPSGYENTFKTWLLSMEDLYISLTSAAIPWKDHDNVLVIKFEDFLASNSTTLSNLTTLLNPRSKTIAKSLSNVEGQQNGTMMEHQSTWDEYTFDWLDDWYVSSGLQDLNKSLGYDS